MRISVAPLTQKIIATMAAFALTFSMAPLAWADDAPAGTLAGSVAGAAIGDEAAEPMVAEGADEEAPSAEVQSADTKAADGSAGGTTISIAVYRSSFPIIKWDLNDDDFGLTKAEWDWTGDLPKSASPGTEVAWPESGRPADYQEPTRDGFEFAGWSTDPSASAGGFIDGSSPALSIPEGTPEAKTYTLHALWTPLKYSVIFDLTKNPEAGSGPGSDAGYALNWETADGVRTVTLLENGCFRVDGFTMDERTYDEVTRTVGLPEPARTGYRFLGWAEPDGQALAIDNAAKDGFALNPVRLTQIDGTPVLTARWTSAFGVTAPLSITFGDYDKTGAPGNPWLGDANSSAADDTTQSKADDTNLSEQEGYKALGQAYFENTGWHEAVKVVGLTSERYASAKEVLTTYDSKLASEAAVLGDGTEANPGERLLSLYPFESAPADKSSGVHFRLSDSLDESALGASFTMGAQGSGSEKLPITYGLNLSTDPTDGSANHGLVLPTNDYERKQIATVSYTFATATTELGDPASGSLLDDLYIQDGALIYGPDNIKAAANDLSLHGTSSRYYEQYHSYLACGMNGATSSWSGNAVYGKVRWDDDSDGLPDTLYDVRIIGICHDEKAGGTGEAGLTLQFVNLLNADMRMNPGGTIAGGWKEMHLRKQLQEGGTLFEAAPSALRSRMVSVNKLSATSNALSAPTQTTVDQFFVLSLSEYSTSLSSDVPWKEGAVYELYASMSPAVSIAQADARFIKGKQSSASTPQFYWLRTISRRSDNKSFTCVLKDGTLHKDADASSSGVADGTTFGVCPAFCL